MALVEKPGPGGWGALILKDNEEIKLHGGQKTLLLIINGTYRGYKSIEFFL